MSNMQPYPDTRQAACAEVGVEMFYTYEDDSDTEKSSRKYLDEQGAKRVCAGCPVREECLNWAIHHEKWGIWGGTNPEQRRLLRLKAGITLVDPYANASGYYGA